MQKKPCGTCKKTNMKNTKTGIAFLGAYVFGTSIYGTIVLIKELINLFK